MTKYFVEALVVATQHKQEWIEIEAESKEEAEELVRQGHGNVTESMTYEEEFEVGEVTSIEDENGK